MAAKKFQPKYQYPKYNPNPITFEEEVTAGVIEWYMARGLPVPQADLEACKGLDAAAAAEAATEAAKPPPPPKPAYGTPEFWKEWWAKKRAKEAAAKANAEGMEGTRGAGCPPIPEPKAKKK